VYSAAERAVDGRRVREFSADELLALARTFGKPVGWFFLPPDDLVVRWRARSGDRNMWIGRGDLAETAVGLEGARERVRDLLASLKGEEPSDRQVFLEIRSIVPFLSAVLKTGGDIQELITQMDHVRTMLKLGLDDYRKIAKELEEKT
jgi:hypothetical protein